MVTINVWAVLEDPTFVDGKVSEAGETVIAAVSVPVRGIACGLPVALSLMEIEALRAPDPAGVNVTLMVQLALAATLAPQVLVWVKSPLLLPVTVIELMVSVVAPVFFNVTA